MAAAGPSPFRLTRSYTDKGQNVYSTEDIIVLLNKLLMPHVFTIHEEAKHAKVRALIDIADTCENVNEFREKASIPQEYYINPGGIQQYINDTVEGGRRKHRTRRNKKQRKQRKHRTRKH